MVAQLLGLPFLYNIIEREKHLNLLTGSRGVTSEANVSSYARAIARTNHSLQRILVKKSR